MKIKTKYIILIALFIISLISSIILSVPSASDTCSIVKGCDIVHNCCYNYTFGIQNSYIGIVAFLFLSVITLIHIRNPTNKKRIIIYAGIIVGSLIALWFLYLQQFIIGAYCQYCLVTDISVLIALLIILFNWRDKK